MGDILTLLLWHQGDTLTFVPLLKPPWEVVLDAPEVSISNLPALLSIHENPPLAPTDTQCCTVGTTGNTVVPVEEQLDGELAPRCHE